MVLLVVLLTVDVVAETSVSSSIDTLMVGRLVNIYATAPTVFNLEFDGGRIIIGKGRLDKPEVMIKGKVYIILKTTIINHYQRIAKVTYYLRQYDERKEM